MKFHANIKLDVLKIQGINKKKITLYKLLCNFCPYHFNFYSYSQINALQIKKNIGNIVEDRIIIFTDVTTLYFHLSMKEHQL